MRPLKLALGAVSLLSLFAACKKPEADSSEAKKNEPVVARIGSGTITVDEFKARLGEQPPFVRSRYTTLERKKEFLENLIRFELLAQEARKQGLDQDPEVLATLEKVLVQKLLQKHSASVTAQPVSEEEVRKYYQEHLSEFMRPERVRVSHVFLAAAAKEPRRGHVKTEATRLLAELRRPEASTDKTTFAELVRKRSDDAATKPMDGDLGFKTQEELSALWGTGLAQAAFALNDPAAVTEVETEKGIHLIKLGGRQPGLAQTFEMARQRIESSIQMERRSRAIDELVSALKKNTSIELNDPELEKVDVQDASGLPGAVGSAPQP